MSFLHPLYDLPSLSVFAAFGMGAALLAALSCLLLSRILRPPEAKEHIDIAMRTQGAVVAAITLTLAFCAVQARTQFTQAERLVHAEAAAIAQLVRLSERVPDAQGPLQAELRAYLREVTGREYPHLADIGRHPEAQRATERLEAVVHDAALAVGGSLGTELQRQGDDLEEAREERLHAAASGLPVEFWQLIALLFGLLFATSALFPARRHTVAMQGIQAACLGALVAFVFQMDQPFRGTFAVKPDPLVRVLDHLEGRRGGAVLVRHDGGPEPGARR